MSHQFRRLIALSWLILQAGFPCRAEISLSGDFTPGDSNLWINGGSSTLSGVIGDGNLAVTPDGAATILTLQDLVLGANAGTSGWAEISGALDIMGATVPNLVVGQNGQGVLAVYGGTVNAGIVELGTNAGSSGTVVVNGAAAVFTNDIFAMQAGAATVTISGGGQMTSRSAGFAGETAQSVLITDPGSSWTLREEVGGGALVMNGNSHLLVTSGGSFTGGTGLIEGSPDPVGVDGFIQANVAGTPTVTVQGAGSTFRYGSKLTVNAEIDVFSGGEFTAAEMDVSQDSAVEIKGAGSVLNASGGLTLEQQARLVVSNQGAVTSGTIMLTGNSVTTVDGAGTSLTTTGHLTLTNGAGLEITNGAQVGSGSTSSVAGGARTRVSVSGTGSVWQSTGDASLANTEVLISQGGRIVLDAGISLNDGTQISMVADPHSQILINADESGANDRFEVNDGHITFYFTGGYNQGGFEAINAQNGELLNTTYTTSVYGGTAIDSYLDSWNFGIIPAEIMNGDNGFTDTYLAGKRAGFFGDDLVVCFLENFELADHSPTFDYSVSLAGALPDTEEFILGAYDIGGNAGFGSLLSVRVGEGYDTEDFSFWQKTGSGEWELYDPGFVWYDGERIDFEGGSSGNSYAVTTSAVPEPSIAILLGVSSLVLFAPRRRLF